MGLKNKLLEFFKAISPKNITNKGMASEEARSNALCVIEKHGLEAHYYLPSIGSRKDEELSHALDLLSSSGFIITDQNGQLIGKVAKTGLSSQEKAEISRSTFKVVASD